MLLLVSLGAAPLERAEIYFVDAARAMVESGDYLVPRYRGEPFFDKPPLTYWLMAASFRVFGFTLAAARLVPVTAALALLAATAWLGRLIFDRATGVAAAAVLASTVLFLSFGRVAMSDMLLALWTTLAVALSLARRECGRPAPASRSALALGIVLGLGFLTKGPIAVLLPGLGIAAWAWRRRRLPAAGRRVRAGDRGLCRPSASRGSRSSTGAWARRRSSTSSCARTSSASRARPTTRAARRRITSAPTSRSACPGRCSSRAPRSACRAESGRSWSGSR